MFEHIIYCMYLLHFYIDKILTVKKHQTNSIKAPTN